MPPPQHALILSKKCNAHHQLRKWQPLRLLRSMSNDKARMGYCICLCVTVGCSQRTMWHKCGMTHSAENDKEPRQYDIEQCYRMQ